MKSCRATRKSLVEWRDKWQEQKNSDVRTNSGFRGNEWCNAEARRRTEIWYENDGQTESPRKKMERNKICKMCQWYILLDTIPQHLLKENDRQNVRVSLVNWGSKARWGVANSMTAAGEGRSADPLPPMPLKSLWLIAGPMRGKMSSRHRRKTCHGCWKPSNDGAVRMRARTRNLVRMDGHGLDWGGEKN